MRIFHILNPLGIELSKDTRLYEKLLSFNFDKYGNMTYFFFLLFKPRTNVWKLNTLRSTLGLIIIIILVSYYFQKDYNGLTFVSLLAVLTVSSNRVM